MHREKLTNKRILIPLMLVLYIVGIAKSTAEIYQWEDENGKTHFGDQLPESKVKNKKIVKQGSPTSLIKGNTSDSERKQKQAASWYKQRLEKSRIEDKKLEKEKITRARENKIKKEICGNYKKKLSDYKAQLKARKRAGIKPRHENQMRITIEQYKRDVGHYCK